MEAYPIFPYHMQEMTILPTNEATNLKLGPSWTIYIVSQVYYPFPSS